jgi:heat shock protein HslJ
MVITPEQINGNWTLLTLQPQGQPEAGPPVGATFLMEISGGRAAVTADCNRCNGPAIVGGTTLTVGPAMACTRAFCASAPLDDVFLKLLAGESAASIEGDVLALRADRGILRFRR